MINLKNVFVQSDERKQIINDGDFNIIKSVLEIYIKHRHPGVFNLQQVANVTDEKKTTRRQKVLAIIMLSDFLL